MFHTVSHFIITSFNSSYRPESKPSSMINLYHPTRPHNNNNNNNNNNNLFTATGLLPGGSGWTL